MRWRGRRLVAAPPVQDPTVRRPILWRGASLWATCKPAAVPAWWGMQEGMPNRSCPVASLLRTSPVFELSQATHLEKCFLMPCVVHESSFLF